ncbi:MAG: ATP-dependent DNA ligase [Candidatus Lokiarchaeota archaeon]|nr:ATP-dependent DNA ligase [Candidatus Lokiarchaeota archaeon]MBD3202298.1 ATP-dependent DNA ligase [Candidatus Lokiarchaeota archaeon]
MRFNKLAHLLSDLESTSKRLEMTNILSKFFKEIKKSQDFEDINQIIYLLQGQLVSNIKQMNKMGIAEKMLIEALSVHSGISKKKIRELLIKKGDIGLTAEIILNEKKTQKSLFDFNNITDNEYSSLEISKLHAKLRKIASSTGEGSHDTKLGILRGLIRKISPLETKYLLRIITSTLRVGVSTQTIIDGLALGFTNEKENRDIIEQAYNLHPDLGDIVRILAKEGLEKVRKIEISYGIPIRMMLASRVPYSEIISKLGKPFKAEYKLDGERLQIHKQGNKIQLFSRRLLEISDQYPDVCAIIRDNITVESAILEGEVVAMDVFYDKMLPFQVLSRRRRKYEVEEKIKDIPVCLYLFDLLRVDGTDYIYKILPERRSKLEEIVETRDELKIVNSKLIESTEDLLDFFNEARSRGTEGIIAKSVKEDSIYQAGNRGFLWIKLKGLEGGKLKDTVDVVLVGAFYGRGRRSGVYGTYIGAVYNPKQAEFIAFTRIASGWTDEIMNNLMEEMKKFEVPRKPSNVICEDEPDTWLNPEVVIEIIGDEITISEKFSSLGYSMRFPVFQRFRKDKGPEDITTVNEIENLYKTQ